MFSEVHELQPDRSIELNYYVDIAFTRRSARSHRPENAQPSYAEALTQDWLLVPQ